MPKPFSYSLEYGVVSRVSVILPLYDNPFSTGMTFLFPSGSFNLR